MDVTITPMTEADIDRAQEGFRAMGWSKPEGYFRKCYEAQDGGAMVVLLALAGERYVGHVKVVWEPDYPPFREAGIPEAQDLNVIPEFRRRGVATRLMDQAEALMGERSRVAGIGVGLHPGYNAAQRMYVKRGYVPDGRGVVWHDRFVEIGQTVTMDDALILHLTKELKPPA